MMKEDWAETILQGIDIQQYEKEIYVDSGKALFINEFIDLEWEDIKSFYESMEQRNVGNSE